MNATQSALALNNSDICSYDFQSMGSPGTLRKNKHTKSSEFMYFIPCSLVNTHHDGICCLHLHESSKQKGEEEER
jgi:hypothetical protein